MTKVSKFDSRKRKRERERQVQTLANIYASSDKSESVKTPFLKLEIGFEVWPNDEGGGNRIVRHPN